MTLLADAACNKHYYQLLPLFRERECDGPTACVVLVAKGSWARPLIHTAISLSGTRRPRSRKGIYVMNEDFFERRLAFWVVHKKFHPQKIFESIIFAHFLCGARRPDIPTNITGIFTLIFLSFVNMEEFRMTQIWEDLVWLQGSPIAFWEPLKKLYLDFLIHN